MPRRTRSWRASGWSSAPAELARCRTSGRRPASSASAQASSKACCCAALAGWSGSSAHAKWDHRPVTRTAPSSSAACAAGDQGQPLGPGRASAGQAGVELQLHAAPVGRPRAHRGRCRRAARPTRRSRRRRPAPAARSPPRARRASTAPDRSHRPAAGPAPPRRWPRRATPPRPDGRRAPPGASRGRRRPPSPRPSAAGAWPSVETSSRSRDTLCRTAPRSMTISACGLDGLAGLAMTRSSFHSGRAGFARPPAPRRPRRSRSTAHHRWPRPRQRRAATTRPRPRRTGRGRRRAATR